MMAVFGAAAVPTKQPLAATELRPVYAPLTTRRGRLEGARRRIIGALLVVGLASFSLGPIVGIALTIVALELCLLVGFELSRPVSSRIVIDRCWTSVVYPLCLGPFLALALLIAFSQLPSVRVPGTGEDPDYALALLGGWTGAIGAVTASIHILRRRAPTGIFHKVRHSWLLALPPLVCFWTAPAWLAAAMAPWGVLLGLLIGGAIYYTISPRRGPPQRLAADALDTTAVPTFRQFRGA